MARKRKAAPLSIIPGSIVRELSRNEETELVQLWLASFGRHTEGIDVSRYRWHVFSAKRFPSMSREEALQAYASHEAREYVAISNDGRAGFVTNARPRPSMFSDWLVFPPNMAWTMAFTHEDGWLGPFFARHPQHARLNAANLTQIQKATAAAEATTRAERLAALGAMAPGMQDIPRRLGVEPSQLVEGAYVDLLANRTSACPS